MKPQFSKLGSWKVIVLSFLVASVFWFFKALGKEYSSRITYPIEFVYDRDSLVALRELASRVTLDVTAGGWELFRHGVSIGEKPIQIVVDNPDKDTYFLRADLFPLLISQMKDFTINFLIEDTLHTPIEQKISKQVQLAVDSTQIRLEEGYRRTSSFTITPNEIKLIAPKSFFDTVKLPLLVGSTLRNIGSAFDDEVPVSIATPFYEVIAAPDEVNLQFEVDKFNQLSIEADITSIGFPTDSSARLSIDVVDVKFVVQNTLRKKYFKQDFSIIADFQNITSDTLIPLVIDSIPEHILEVKIVPDTLKVYYVN